MIEARMILPTTTPVTTTEGRTLGGTDREPSNQPG
jgi:hypothetical protein